MGAMTRRHCPLTNAYMTEMIMITESTLPREKDEMSGLTQLADLVNQELVVHKERLMGFILTTLRESFAGVNRFLPLLLLNFLTRAFE